MYKWVVIVDTSNEIAGDGDIRHPRIGRVRRMQVPRPSEQHAAGSDINAVIARLGVPAEEVVHTLDSATLVLALKRYNKPQAPWHLEMEAKGVPVYVLQHNTVSQIQKHLAAIF